jgi:hypothetical protein
MQTHQSIRISNSVQTANCDCRTAYILYTHLLLILTASQLSPLNGNYISAAITNVLFLSTLTSIGPKTVRINTSATNFRRYRLSQYNEIAVSEITYSKVYPYWNLCHASLFRCIQLYIGNPATGLCPYINAISSLGQLRRL